MSDVAAAAVIAPLASVVGSPLMFIVEIRPLRRSLSTLEESRSGASWKARLDRVEGLRMSRSLDSLTGPELVVGRSHLRLCSP